MSFPPQLLAFCAAIYNNTGMSDIWRFKDEWLVRGLGGIKGAAEAEVVARAENKLYLSQALVEAGVLTLEQLVTLVETVFKTKYYQLTYDKVDKFGVSLLKEKICRKYGILPVGVNETEIKLAAANPADMNAQMDVESLTGRRALVLFSQPAVVEACIDQVFKSDEVMFDLLKKVESQDEVVVLGVTEARALAAAQISSPVIALVNSIISQAYRKKSSDIHIEHDESSSHVRIRVDGVLRNIMTLPRHIGIGPLVARIKIMADLDISNHMRPQDGRSKLRIGDAEVGLRVSILPTSFGEKVVMRILDQRAAEVPFEKLGFSPVVAEAIDKCAAATQGIILITGPTGSGKTTTLYSILNKIKNESTNIVTVEDPIEYKLPGINQVQVNDKQNLGFATVLRSVLRQDPDIILVGEIRDRETADVAFQAAMTGHLVFSTLHTNNTTATIARLMDMGVDRFKIAPGLLCITAQRLVRCLCPRCIEKVPQAELDAEIIAAMGAYGFEKVYYRGRGCKFCEGSGYAGRTSIVELLLATAKVKALINSGGKEEEVRCAALESDSLRTLTKDALWQMSEGKVDLAEGRPYLELKALPCPAAPAQGPVAPVPVLPIASPPAPVQVSVVPDGKPVVMIVEDDAVMRMLLRRFIGNAGYAVVEAVDGEDALTAIAASEPDLLVSDIHMPRMDGLQLVKAVRQTLMLMQLPVIMLTTESSDKSQEMAFKLGADDYIIKPFKAPLVMARITAALRRAGRVK